MLGKECVARKKATCRWLRATAEVSDAPERGRAAFWCTPIPWHGAALLARSEAHIQQKTHPGARAGV